MRTFCLQAPSCSSQAPAQLICNHAMLSCNTVEHGRVCSAFQYHGGAALNHQWAAAGQEEEARLEEDENATRKQLKANREHHKAWEGNREKRIGSWREFEKKKPKKAKTGIKPPKLKVQMRCPCRSACTYSNVLCRMTRCGLAGTTCTWALFVLLTCLPFAARTWLTCMVPCCAASAYCHTALSRKKTRNGPSCRGLWATQASNRSASTKCPGVCCVCSFSRSQKRFDRENQSCVTRGTTP